MSPSPPRPRREPRRLNSGTAPQSGGGLEIRIVPYSPPRISSGTSNSASVSSRPMSHNDSNLSPLPTPSQRQSYAVDQDIDEDERQPWIRHDTSPSPPHSSRLTNAAALYSHDSDNISVSTSRASSPRPSSSSRPRRIISVNSGSKTFSLLPLSGSATSRSESLGSTQPSSTTPSSSWGRVSSNAFIIEDRASSPLTPLSERRSFTSFSEKTPPSESTRFPSWDHRMRGGMRTVEKTPDPQSDAPDETPEAPDQGWPSPLEALPEVSSDVDSQQEVPSRNLLNKDSFQSSQSASTLSERTNYKVYGQSSPVVALFSQQETSDVDDSSSPPSLPPSSSHSNYQILAASSSDIHSIRDYRPQTGDSDANYVIHGGPSASNSSLVTSGSQLRSEYSRESLVVAPLRPVKQRSFERPTAFKSRSRESLRRGSLSSLSSTLSQEATRALFTGSFNVYTQGGVRKQQPWGMSANSMSMMGSHPHQWSAPLSTVMSESEGGSAPPSRSLSAFSGGDRRGSANSRHVLSISSSLLGLDAHAAASSLSRTTSLEAPPAALGPNSPRDPSGSMLQIRDHDEYGDGLADLDASHQRPSRTRLASFVSNSSDRILRSSGSTGSLNMFSFPGWARLYYGSGERRFLIAQPSSDSIRSMYNGSMYNEHAPLPPVAQHNGPLNRSPSAERFTSSIRNPRRRARDMAMPQGHAGPSTEHQQPDIVPDHIQPPSRVMSIARRVRRRTSSVWSPHLRQDKRASGYSIWEPPPAPWTTDNGFEWRRNRQIVLFVMGFLIPFGKKLRHPIQFRNYELTWIT